MALLLVAAVACRPALPAEGWVGTTEVHGDTTVVTSRAPTIRRPIVHDSAEILWGSDSLDYATGPMVLSNGELAIADKYSIYLLSPEGRLLRSFGRAGQGPGEFGEVTDLGAAGDSLIAVDFSQRRVTFFDTAGKVLAIRNLPQTAELKQPLPVRVTGVGHGVLLGLASIIFVTAPRPAYGVAALAWNGGDSAVELVRVMGQRHLFDNGYMTQVALFGPKPLFGFAPDGKIASTDGMTYCVDVRPLTGVERLRICREWSPVKVTSAVRHPDIEAYAKKVHAPAEWVSEMESWLGRQEIGDIRNSIDRILWDRADRLWVRVEDSLDANVHPNLEARVADLRPRLAHWDLFAPDGKLLAEEYLPGRFTPYDGDANWLYGIYELESGEVAVARVDAGVAR